MANKGWTTMVRNSAKTRACPTCGAKPYADCTGKLGPRKSVHRERLA